MATQTTQPTGAPASGTLTRKLPVPTRLEIFTTRGQTYEILRFPKGQGPNLFQSIEIAEGMEGKSLLTRQEAEEIRDNDESNRDFRIPKLSPNLVGG